MKNFIFTFVVSIFMIGCQEILDIDGAIDTVPENITENVYAISEEEALENLHAFMASSETKSSDVCRIVSISPIKYKTVKTKTYQDDLNCENLLYVANFEGNQGYAILAGDTRIGEEVLAVVDGGYISDKTIYTAIELANEDRHIFEDYPLTGPGFFTTPETGDEVFMNPNTVILYDEEEQDTLVGNFEVDESEESDSTGTKSSYYNNTYPSPAEIISSRLCVTYAINEISGNSSRGATIGGGDDDNLPDDGPEQNPPFDNTPHGPQPLQPWTETEVSRWSDVVHHTPLLIDFVNWSQYEPFNNLYPITRRVFMPWVTKRAAAGCFPLAIAKILTYFEYGNIYNGYDVNWRELKNNLENNEGAQSAANLLKDISTECDCWYFYGGTFTFPWKATAYMRNRGLNEAHSYDYSFDKVTEMINNEKPLIIFSVPGIDVTSSHSWNIDGYKIKKRTITTTTYLGDEVQSVSTEEERKEMVHCDFGWSGDCNGYYVSGIFKIDDPNVDRDPDVKFNKDTNYNKLIKVITY